MPRNTRNRRGGDVEAMQDDPEAILRRRRQGARNTRPASADPRTDANASLNAANIVEAGRASEQDPAIDSNNSARVNNDGQNQQRRDPALADTGANLHAHSANDEEQSIGTSASFQAPPSDRARTHAGFAGDHGEQAQDSSTSSFAQESTNEVSTGDSDKSAPSNSNEPTDGGERSGSRDGLRSSAIDPKDSPQVAGGTGPADAQNTGEQPALTSSERLRASLTALQQEAVGAPVLDEHSTVQENRDLDYDTLFQAIASVTEAISERGHVLFCPVSQLTGDLVKAARPSQNILWPHHRTRGGGGGHFSLFIIERDIQEYGFRVSFRDSWLRTRNGARAREAWDDVRRRLTESRWHDQGLDGVPLAPIMAEHQFDQTQSWSCGIFTIINAWIHALGLDLFRTESGTPQIGTCIQDACRLVRYAMQGLLSSATIKDFLECYHFVQLGAIIHEHRTFQCTLALVSPEALDQRVADLLQEAARNRLEDEFARYQGANQGEEVVSVDDMLVALEPAGLSSNLTQYATLDELQKTYDSRDDNRSALGGETDEEMTRRLQQDEYNRDLTPERDQSAAGQEQQTESGEAQQGRRSNAEAGQRSQATDQGVEQADSPAAQSTQAADWAPIQEEESAQSQLEREVRRWEEEQAARARVPHNGASNKNSSNAHPESPDLDNPRFSPIGPDDQQAPPPAEQNPDSAAPLADPRAPALGQPTIPGLQSTIPPAAPTAPTSVDQPTHTSTQHRSVDSGSSLPSLSQYEREEEEYHRQRQGEAERAREQTRADHLATSSAAFERQTNEQRQRSRRSNAPEPSGDEDRATTAGGDLRHRSAGSNDTNASDNTEASAGFPDLDEGEAAGDRNEDDDAFGFETDEQRAEREAEERNRREMDALFENDEHGKESVG